MNSRGTISLWIDEPYPLREIESRKYKGVKERKNIIERWKQIHAFKWPHCFIQIGITNTYTSLLDRYLKK